jgi:hypothetical protein
MDKEKKVLKLIRNIKDPKLRMELRKDLMKLVKLKRLAAEAEEKAFNEMASKYGNKFKSTTLH